MSVIMMTNNKWREKESCVLLLLLCMTYTLISVQRAQVEESQFGKAASIYIASFVQENDLESLKLRAEQGDTNAQLNLGWMYFHGQGVSQDY